jgi:hypothetical protein
MGALTEVGRPSKHARTGFFQLMPIHERTEQILDEELKSRWTWIWTDVKTLHISRRIGYILPEKVCPDVRRKEYYLSKCRLMRELNKS